MAEENQENNIVEDIAPETNEVNVTEEVEEKAVEASEEAKVEELEDDSVVVTIGEDSPPEEDKTEAPEWVKELRKSHREIQKENRELKERLKEPTENKPVELGKKPTLEESDYDSDDYENKLTAWYDKKKDYDESQNQIKLEQDNQSKAWQSTLDGYGKAKEELKVKDYEEAESVVENTLSNAQQGMILQGADNAALIVYALGKNPKRAKEISEIKDPVKFAFAVAKLETQLKVTNRKTPPPPESKVSGTANISGVVDSTLEKLRVKASQTGDFSEVIKYKAAKAKKAS